MPKLRRNSSQPVAVDGSSLRLRASWLYYNHGLTQKDVCEKLGTSRATVIRLLAEAVHRGEVQIWISEGEGDCIELALQLEDALSIDEAIVVPQAATFELAAKSVGLALGKFLSEADLDGFTIGVGWGRTLMGSLASLRPSRREGVKIVSLLDGVVQTSTSNPLEYTWRMASQFGAECYLFIAPVFVDCADTKQRLIEHCGLDEIYRLANQLDLAVISVGDVGATGSSLSLNIVKPHELAELIELGCVCDVLCNFLDTEGRSIEHPLTERVMSIGLDVVRRSKRIVIASGGENRATAIRAAIRRVGCNTLITDEGAARALLKMS
jgi:DNA-binding transcriptional regulator LsrR (DeoR family)